jgi:hypothetical protein
MVTVGPTTFSTTHGTVSGRSRSMVASSIHPVPSSELLAELWSWQGGEAWMAS